MLLHMDVMERVIILVPEEPDEPPARKPSRWNVTLTEDLIKDFAGYIKRGLPADGVCDLMGISNNAFWLWLKRGQAYLNSDQSDPSHELCGYFVVQFKKALAEYRLQLITDLDDAGEKIWKKYLEILERRDRKTFGKADPGGGADDEFDVDERFL